MKGHDECARHGCPPPVYEVSAGDPGDIQVRIGAAPDAIVSEEEPNGERATNGRNQAIKDGRPIKRPINRPIKRPVKRPVKEGVLDAIKESPGLSRPQLMSILGKGRTVVTEALAILQKEGLIEHQGSRKTGGYFARGNP